MGGGREQEINVDATLSPDTSDRYDVFLFLNGSGDFAARTAAVVRRICETYFEGYYHLHIVDVQRDKLAAAHYNILLTPTLLVCRSSRPTIAAVGDLSHPDKLIAALRLPWSANAPLL